MPITIPFVMVPGSNDVVTLWNKTAEECLESDLRPLVSKVMKLGDTSSVEVGSASVHENGEEPGRGGECHAQFRHKCWIYEKRGYTK